MDNIKSARMGKRKWQQMWSAYILVFPAVLSLAVFLIGPILYAFVLGFKDQNLLNPGAGKFIGFGNYFSLLHDPVFLKALTNTFKYSFTVVPVQTVIALFLAIVANQNIRGKTFFRIAYYLPSVTSLVAISTIFAFLFNRNGVVNQLLSQIGFQPVNWFSSPSLALPLVIIIGIFVGIGGQMIIFLAGLQDIPESLYEAAKVDGASPFQQFKSITFPLLKEKTFFVLIIGFIGTLQVFDQAYIISRGSGGPLDSTMTVVLYIYRKAFSDNQVGYASAAAFILFVLIFTLTIIQRRLIGQDTKN
jgi:multiple sugar transport system permease protein